MVDDETKTKLIEELEKNGNVSIACMKTGVHRSSFYRWKEEDKEFAEKAILAERYGRENNCDIAEHSLMINVKEKKMEAIKYLLSHNHPMYMLQKADRNETIIRHQKGLTEAEEKEIVKKYNEEDLVKQVEYTDMMEKKFQETGELPKTSRTKEEYEYLERLRLYIEQYNEENSH